MDIMDQHNGTVIGIVHDGLVDMILVAVFPVLRIDGPDNQRIINQLPHTRIGAAVRRTDQVIGITAADPVENRHAVFHLTDHLLVLQINQIRVIPAVAGNFVAVRVSLLNQIQVIAGILSQRKKCRLDIALLEALQQLGGIGAVRSVVECQGNQFVTLCGTGPQRQRCKDYHTYQNPCETSLHNRHPFSFYAHILPFYSEYFHHISQIKN